MTVTGNVYDKYGSTNPLARRLMAGFEGALDDLLAAAAPRSLLDVGCGEGLLTERFARRLAGGRVVGVDLDDAALRAQWESRRAPGLAFAVARAEALPFAEGEFELAAAIEVLEHVADPDRALAELARVARGGHLLVSVPREPVWRALNVLRGAYLRDAGNTPGHVNHWSRRAFEALVARHGEIRARRAPLPWTMLLVRV